MEFHSEIAGLRAVTEDIDRLRTRLELALAAAERHQAQSSRARSDGGRVEAAMDWQSRLVALTIERSALTRTRGSQLADEVVQAVNRARERIAGPAAVPGDGGVTVDIPGGAGRLRVDQQGNLAAVTFDERVVRAMHPDRLAEYLTTAFHDGLARNRDALLDSLEANRI